MIKKEYSLRKLLVPTEPFFKFSFLLPLEYTKLGFYTQARPVYAILIIRRKYILFLFIFYNITLESVIKLYILYDCGV